jgi:hypothetical protein
LAQDIFNDLTLDLVYFFGIINSLKGINPTDVSHGCIATLHVELVLEADRQSVQRPEGFIMLGHPVIEKFSTS